MLSMICAVVTESDDQAFMIQFYERYKNLMFYTAKTVCQDRDAWEDIMQESILRLIPRLDQLRAMEEKARTSYVVVTVRNTAYTHLRQTAREKARLVSWEDVQREPEVDMDDAVERLIREEETADLAAVWPMLSPRDRFLLESRYYLEDSDEQIAKQLGCSKSSVRTMVSRARKRALALMMDKENAR